ncbi:MAG: hypothetical protein EA001_05770 [Oscillatoriales cyanobacterium]|nr:MAG: hypothetical protein EA001_05770 [Oscillatoriales cyanobacterium]
MTGHARNHSTRHELRKMTILALLIMFVVAIAPALVSLRAVHRYEQQVQVVIDRARRVAGPRRSPLPEVPELVHVPGAGYVIGDLSCRFNARSPQLRCAVNPSGPCAGCRLYESTP